MKRLLLTCLGTLVLSVNGLAAPTADQVDLSDHTGQVSYSIGYQVGGDLKKQHIEVRQEMLVRGIQDALSGNRPLIPKDEMFTSLVELKQRTEAIEKQPQASSDKK